ncbi:MAG: HAD-IC family P-type ATPase [Candidatus Krumholzibacteria bacterium]|jgi:calcium-translocating P-type ATPase|nr:HAD-IC family P-type ATPase [Candidatus Krumholzibacteria bacterium]
MASTARDLRIEPTAWHALTPAEALARQDTRADTGLDEAEVARRREEFGPNTLPGRKPPTLLAIFLHQFANPLIYVLLAAAVVSVVIGESKDAIFILLVILLNATIGTTQEWKAESSAAALQQLLSIQVRVKRGGGDRTVPAEELVPGDIVLLESGNKVPADLRLLTARSLEMDESFLTGESQAAAKTVDALDEDTGVSDRRNIAFAGATTTSGRGVGLVVATGPETEVGKIARSVTEGESSKPPLLIRMERFAHQISFIVLGASAALAAIAISQGIPWLEVFFLAVALAVSAIPEGLPVALTVALSIATSRMARRKVIVRKLTAVESLGSCQIIASDKTGTLTVNQQTVKQVRLPSGEDFAVTGEGYNGEGEVRAAQDETRLDETSRQHLERLVRAVILCNEAELERDGSRDGQNERERGAWRHSGDAIPFESERRYAAQAFRSNVGDKANGEVTVVVKGAAETVLPLCRDMVGPERVVDLDREGMEAAALELADHGYRVLAVAEGELADEAAGAELAEDRLPPLTLLGLVGFIDPLRPEAKDAVQECHEAGIEVIMITGDHPATAQAIARDLGIAEGRDDVITGDELAAVGEPGSREFLDAVNGHHVFARVSPLQKLDIVGALVEAGHFVAVTGDGVNDAPALRRANIGVAMGSGTDVAKDTAEMIVTDDNFASIVAGVEEGRFAYDNVRKVTYLLVATGAAEVLLFTLSLLAGLPLPLLAVQILWLNLVTNGIQDVALAFEGGEPGAMQRPPRRPSEGIFNGLMIQQTLVAGLAMGLLAFGLWAWLAPQTDAEIVAGRNLLLLLMVLLQNAHVFNCRSEYVSAFKVPLRRNTILVFGVLAAQGLHILSMQLPFMQSLLRIEPISFKQWGTLLLVAVPILAAMELFKAVRGSRRSGTRASTAGAR